MSQILQAFVILPLLAFLASLLLPRKNETLLSGIAIATTAVHLAGLVLFIAYWLVSSYPVLDARHMVFFKSSDIEIFIALYFDAATAVFALVGSMLTLLVALFSRYYLHREEGFKRFFATLLLFFLGYNLVVFSGNYETLFIGWEALGICSFLLIAFYRDRYLPVKNGLKVISIYRLGDICLILAMWMSHHLWHENITFAKLNDAALVQTHLLEQNGYAVFIASMVLIAAAVKSAQLPFSSWLPRAMEGPTTSSAVFYGSLSVHLGVFLLLRTYAYWEAIMVVKVLVIVLGFLTSLVATSIARVQSSVKTQIAYASITQIGLMFVEVGLGFHTLALIHFAGNAFLRTYQLLVSPSVLSYLIHDMVFHFKPQKQPARIGFLHRIKSSLYILSIKEYNLDAFLHRFFWSPFKWVGSKLPLFSGTAFFILLVLLFSVGVYSDFFPHSLPGAFVQSLPILFSLIGLLLILKSFAERDDAKRAWAFLMGAQLFITLAVTLAHEAFRYHYILLFLSGSVLLFLMGYACLKKIAVLEKNVALSRFHGHTYEHPLLAFIFLISCLGLVGLPFTPTFIGMDVLFSHISKQSILLITFIALSFLFMELAALRIYARIFLGQHTKAYHPIAYRSS